MHCWRHQNAVSHRYDDDDDGASERSRRDEHIVQVVQVDGYGHLQVNLAVPVAG